MNAFSFIFYLPCKDETLSNQKMQLQLGLKKLKTTKLYVAGWVIDGDAIDWMNSDVLQMSVQSINIRNRTY